MRDEVSGVHPSSGVARLAISGLMVAVLCASPSKSVPAAIIGLLLPPREALLVVLGYLGLGFCGLPVLAGYRGGVGYLLGPDGAFILVPALQAPLVSWLFLRRPGLGWREITGPLVAGYLAHATLGASGMVWMGGYPLRAAVLSFGFTLPWVGLKILLVGGFFRLVAPRLPGVMRPRGLA